MACSEDCEPPEAEEDRTPNVQRLHFGTYHVCVIDDRQSIWCTGQNAAGQLGDGTTRSQDELVEVAGLGNVADFAVGLFDTNCAIDGDGALYCWGSNRYGVLADDDLELSAEPVPIDGVGSVVDIAVGAFHACAVNDESQLFCWGRNDRGQLGLGVDADPIVTSPQRVEDVGPVRAVHAGGAHSCSLGIDGEVHCWGSNEFGQLGLAIDRTTDVGVPQNISPFLPDGVVDLQVAFHHSCAVAGDERQLFCWGANDYGQFGLDDTDHRLEPTPIPEIAYVDELALGGGQVCVDIDGDIYCAGEVMRPVEAVEQSGEGFIFRRSDVLQGVDELWGGVLAVCGPTDVDTVACRGIEHEGLGDDVF